MDWATGTFLGTGMGSMKTRAHLVFLSLTTFLTENVGQLVKHLLRYIVAWFCFLKNSGVHR